MKLIVAGWIVTPFAVPLMVTMPGTVARTEKTAFPTAVVYGPTPLSELRLVTCGGEFDRVAGSYRDNVIVEAVLKT